MNPSLFSETRLGSATLRNRLVFCAPSPAYGGLDEEANQPNNLLADYWEEIARRGVGLIIGEPQSIHPTSTTHPRTIENLSDAVVPLYRRVTEAVHGRGGVIFGHLWHAGLRGASGYRSLPLWAPSAVSLPPGAPAAAGGGSVGYAMRKDDIEELIEAYASAGRRVREAGFDGVEVNAASGFLLADFLSPKVNRREDEYGGSLENRCRLVAEVLDAVRAAVGKEFPLGVRLGPDLYIEPGILETDLPEIAGRLATTSDLDYISVFPALIPDTAGVEGAGADVAGAIRKATGLPVIYSGLLTDVDKAESLVRDAGIDLVDMTRPLLADPDLSAKARAGPSDGIRACIACNQTCTESTTTGFGAAATPRCLLNPIGAGAAFSAQRNGDGRRLLVIGAGLAGLEVARLASLRDFAVTIWERDQVPGGQVRLAARMSQRARFGEAITFYQRQLARWNIDLKLGVTATPENVDALEPDIVVVATGSHAMRPQWCGDANGSPLTADIREVLDGAVKPGRRVVIGMSETENGYQALPLAESLADQGHEVTIVSPAFEPAMHQDFYTSENLYRRLLRKGVRIRSCEEVIGASPGEARVRNKFILREDMLPADTVVAAYGGVANDSLYFALCAQRSEVYRAGDCVAPRDIEGAISDAMRIVEDIGQVVKVGQR